MFLNKTVFKKWIKEAYNSGILVVGRVFDGLVLAGSHWIVWADEEHVPNWVKAAVIEHVGHLPSEGTMIQYGKGELDQYVDADDWMNLPKQFLEAKQSYTVTPIVYQGGYFSYRAIQNKDNLKLLALPEPLYGVIDFSNLERSGGDPNRKPESRPAGPAAQAHMPEMLYWKNEQSALALRIMGPSEKLFDDVVARLSDIDFWEVK